MRLFYLIFLLSFIFSPLLCLASEDTHFSPDTQPTTPQEDWFTFIKHASADKVRERLEQSPPKNINLKDNDGNTLLHLSAQENNDSFVLKALLKHKADPFIRNNNNLTAPFLALSNPNIKVLQTLLEATSKNGKFYDADNLLLHAIIEKKNETIISSILPYGANINALDNHGRSPLLLALKSGYDENFIDFLLKKGANIKVKDNDGTTALMTAASYANSPDILKLLTDKGSDLKALDNEKRNILFYSFFNDNPAINEWVRKQRLKRTNGNFASVAGNDDYFLLFCRYALPYEMSTSLKLGANAKAQDDFGRTTLMYAARYNKNPDTLEILIAAGANPLIKDNQGLRALAYAEKNMSRDKIATILIKHGGEGLSNVINNNLNNQHTLGNLTDSGIPFLDLVKIGNSAQIQEAIEKGINPQIKDFYNRTALMTAAGYNPDIEVIKYLIKLGLSTKDKDSGGYTPFLYAARSNPEVKVLETLLTENKFCLTDKIGGKTALILAAANNHNEEIIKLLLSKGLTPNAKDHTGRTALSYAVANNNTSSYIPLLKASSDIEDLQKKEITELIKYALSQKDIKILRLLLNAGITGDYTLNQNETVLSYTVAKSQNPAALKLLLRGEDAIKHTADGKSLLQLALEQNAPYEIIEILVKKGALKEQTSADGTTFLAIAIKAGASDDIQKLLQNKSKARHTFNKTLIQSIKDIKTQNELLALFANGANPRTMDEEGRSLLTLALIANQDEKIIDTLLDNGVRPTPLDILLAAENNASIKTITSLLSFNNIKINMQDEFGETAVFKSVKSGNYPITQYLLSAGANHRSRNKQGQNLLHQTALINHTADNFENTLKIIKLLAEVYQVKINQSDNNGYTPIALAVMNNCPYEVFDAFNKAGAKLKNTFKNNENLLMLAAKFNQDSRIIKALLNEAKISPSAKNKQQQTALLLAKEHNPNPDIAAIISNYSDN